jgi:hypothetical protein
MISKRQNNIHKRSLFSFLNVDLAFGTKMMIGKISLEIETHQKLVL